MFEVSILLNSIDKIKSFSNIITTIDCDIDIMSGHFEIDAKSLVGLLTLDKSKALRLKANTDDEVIIETIKEKLRDLIV